MSAHEERIGRLLGLARRAHGLTVGLRATLRALQHRRLAVIIVADDASARTVAELRGATGATPVVVMGSMAQLGGWVGAAAVAVLGVRRGTLAAQILRLASPGEAP
ncbi:ribosomal L7Ae/L30e/S12e/Gadd45 family protein [Candidatus Fermentibacteria bacterium]|nr:ribosomal L7Ae/L30e/S12e/Gadd45 family protein [Candidatus Fermentibacteria bacterium]